MENSGVLNYIRDQIVQGSDQPSHSLRVWAFLKSVEELVELGKAAIQESAMSELEKYGKEGLTISGYRMTRKNGSVRWKYQGDTIKDAEEHLKALKEIAQMAHRHTQQPMPGPNGELVEPAIAIYDRDSIVCTKQKQQ